MGDAGAFIDPHETNRSRRFKMIASINRTGAVYNPDENNQYTLTTAVSADGKRWTDITNASSMRVAADTANNALYDGHLGMYLAFSRRHCSNCDVTTCEASCGMGTWGVRRETRSLSEAFLGGWSDAIECAHGETPVTYEMYSLTPFRSEHWRPGLYFAVGSFYQKSHILPNGSNVMAPTGYVFCELMVSGNFGANWTRLAPHKQVIKPCTPCSPCQPGFAVTSRGMAVCCSTFHTARAGTPTLASRRTVSWGRTATRHASITSVPTRAL